MRDRSDSRCNAKARQGEAVGFDRTSTPRCFGSAARWIERWKRNEDGTLRGRRSGRSNAQQTGPRVAAVGERLVFRPFSGSTKASTSGFRRQA